MLIIFSKKRFKQCKEVDLLKEISAITSFSTEQNSLE
jgi:hypothetical protein